MFAPDSKRLRFEPQSALLALALFPGAAQAHHVMDGALPSTLGEGLLSGLGHPIIGLDHFLFVVALGVLCWRMNIGLGAVAGFLGASLLGVMLHLASIGIPGNEILVALSLLGVGVSLWRGRGWSRPRAVLPAIAVGIFHGYAYGEAIVGAEAGVLASYLVGLAVIQSLIGAASYWVAMTAARRIESAHGVSRWIGGLVSLAGIGFLLLNVS